MKTFVAFLIALPFVIMIAILCVAALAHIVELYRESCEWHDKLLCIGFGYAIILLGLVAVIMLIGLSLKGIPCEP